MPHIQQLAPHVADLIAAGEVVERPASVVKELVENAMDAGASAVVVEIRRGGMGLIRVTDNGCGIAPEELPTAFLRHATSKLRTAADLGAIGTLGFRGEALAAISAVSRVEIVTAQKGADSGARLRLEGGVAGGVEECGAPVGTTLMVRDLFYNTPARLKFMRKDSAETAAVAGLMQHLALSRPEISFKFIKDGVEALHTPGDGKLSSAVYAALGRDFARTLIPAEGRGGDIAVSGFVTQPLQSRGSRAMQVFFVNGRFIKSQLLTAALEEGYRNQMMKGKFPGCVLCVTLPKEQVDVNVHPAKTQIKFARERDVFDAVYHTVMDALSAASPTAAPEKSANGVTLPRQDFFQTMDAKTYRESAGKPAAPAKPAQRGWNSEWDSRAGLRDSGTGRTGGHTPKAAPAMGTAPRSVVGRSVSAPGAAPGRPVPTAETERPAPQGASGHEPLSRPAPQDAPGSAPLNRPAPQDAPTAKTESPAPQEHVRAQSAGTCPQPERPAPAQETLFSAPQRPFTPAIPDGQVSICPPREAPWRFVGEVLRTYIICESEDGCVWLIDKHAAHERINFDRLKAQKEPPMRQVLLQPLAAQLTREDGALLLEHLAELEAFGFLCEDFGDDTVLVREAPSDIDAAEVGATLEEFAAALRTGRSMEERREAMLHTMACKAAIKGGWVSDPAELKALIGRVQSGEIRFCPHGRPVAVKMTAYELEKLFKRA